MKTWILQWAGFDVYAKSVEVDPLIHFDSFASTEEGKNAAIGFFATRAEAVAFKDDAIRAAREREGGE